MQNQLALIAHGGKSDFVQNAYRKRCRDGAASVVFTAAEAQIISAAVLNVIG